MQNKNQNENKNIELKTTSLERKLKRLVPPNVKSFILYFLVNSHVGKAIKFFKIRWNFFGGKFDYSLVSDKDAADIFWGTWESAEIRFSKRFALSKTIVELGSSVGVTLGVLSNIRTQTKFICVEAALENFEKLNRLKTLLPTNNEYILVNKAIAYDVDRVPFEFTSTTDSKINETGVELGSYVDATTLSDVLEENQIEGEYTLIADIEGAEEAVFYKDEAALKKCVVIIAELTNTTSHTIEEQISKLQDVGFNLTERYGVVVVMSR
jgi:FkbM family methyltransferase